MKILYNGFSIDSFEVNKMTFSDFWMERKMPEMPTARDESILWKKGFSLHRLLVTASLTCIWVKREKKWWKSRKKTNKKCREEKKWKHEMESKNISHLPSTYISWNLLAKCVFHLFCARCDFSLLTDTFSTRELQKPGGNYYTENLFPQEGVLFPIGLHISIDL